jgi:hypothetical protein
VIYPDDRAEALKIRKLVQALERSVVLLRKHVAIHEVGETLGFLDDQQREAMRKLAAKARSTAINALEQDRR